MAILIIGSANLDHTIRLDRPLRMGETGMARSVTQSPGGKGANQAVAAARLSAPLTVAFAGCVGDDQAGSILIDRLASEGVDVTQLRVLPGVRTGAAYVSTYEDGNNTIAVDQGANGFVDSYEVDFAFANMGSAISAVVLQAELGPSGLVRALENSRRIGLRTILNLAPYQEVPRNLLEHCDPLVVNETEASQLLSRPINGGADGVAAVRELASLATSAVITLGAVGAAWSDGAQSSLEAAPIVEHVIDTLGAGDAFVGALAVALTDHNSLRDAVRFAAHAGAYSVAGPGAQRSYATRQVAESWKANM